MKRILFVLGLALTLLSGCKKEDNIDPINPPVVVNPPTQDCNCGVITEHYSFESQDQFGNWFYRNYVIKVRNNCSGGIYTKSDKKAVYSSAPDWYTGSYTGENYCLGSPW